MEAVEAALDPNLNSDRLPAAQRCETFLVASPFGLVQERALRRQGQAEVAFGIDESRAGELPRGTRAGAPVDGHRVTGGVRDGRYVPAEPDGAAVHHSAPRRVQ